jgi:hypothetical protein
MTFRRCELRPTLRFWIGASLLSFGFAHAGLAEDSYLFLYKSQTDFPKLRRTTVKVKAMLAPIAERHG